jgi:hypothetical protein
VGFQIIMVQIAIEIGIEIAKEETAWDEETKNWMLTASR